MAVKEARSRHLNVLKASNKQNASFLVAKAESLCWTTFWTKCLSFWAMRTKRSARSQCYLLLAQCKLSFRTNELKFLILVNVILKLLKKLLILYTICSNIIPNSQFISKSVPLLLVLASTHKLSYGQINDEMIVKRKSIGKCSKS